MEEHTWSPETTKSTMCSRSPSFDHLEVDFTKPSRPGWVADASSDSMSSRGAGCAALTSSISRALHFWRYTLPCVFQFLYTSVKILWETRKPIYLEMCLHSDKFPPVKKQFASHLPFSLRKKNISIQKHTIFMVWDPTCRRCTHDPQWPFHPLVSSPWCT